MDIFPLDRFILASAGGAMYRGAAMKGMLRVTGQASLEEIERCRVATLGEHRFGLRRFVEAPCMIVDRAVIPRRVLIKYIVNTQGGAHYDTKRDDSPEGRLFRRLDSVRGGHIQMASKEISYYELLSAGQALNRASDIQRLRHGASPAKPTSDAGGSP